MTAYFTYYYASHTTQTYDAAGAFRAAAASNNDNDPDVMAEILIKATLSIKTLKEKEGLNKLGFSGLLNRIIYSVKSLFTCTEVYKTERLFQSTVSKINALPSEGRTKIAKYLTEEIEDYTKINNNAEEKNGFPINNKHFDNDNDIIDSDIFKKDNFFD